MVAKRQPPTDVDRAEVVRIALSGIAAGRDFDDIAADLTPFHPAHNTFPGELLLELAADALELSGASRTEPLDYSGIRERYLPDFDIRGKYQHRKSHFVLRSAVFVRAGVDPAILDEVAYWNTDDFYVWALFALFIFVRAAAERTESTPDAVCVAIAERRDIQLTS